MTDAKAASTRAPSADEERDNEEDHSGVHKAYGCQKQAKHNQQMAPEVSGQAERREPQRRQMSGHWSPSKTPERQDRSQTNSCASHTSETSDQECFPNEPVKTTLGEESEEGVKSARRRESGTSHRRYIGDIVNSWCWRLKGQRAAPSARSPCPCTMAVFCGVSSS